ncbi:MAG: DinB family protein [Gracilimonas sp.]
MDLQRLLDYDKWANTRVFKTIKTVADPEVQKDINKLFAHLLTAQIIWVNRINDQPLPNEIWPDLSISEIKSLLQKNPEKLKKLVSRKNEIFHYKNSKGEEFKNSVEEILVHLTIHGQHHRAQIANLLRKAGITPPGTDFIFFLRTLDN